MPTIDPATEVLISVQVELVETLRQAQGEQFILHRAESIMLYKA